VPIISKPATPEAVITRAAKAAALIALRTALRFIVNSL
jgi:hypothetical protein